MIGMGRKKSLTYSLYTHLPKEDGEVFRGCFFPCYFFLQGSNTEWKVRIHMPPAAAHQQGFIWKLSLSSPVKNKNQLLLWSSYCSLPLKINTIFLMFLMICCGFQARPFLWGKVCLTLCSAREACGAGGGTVGFAAGFFGLVCSVSSAASVQATSGLFYMRTYTDDPGTSPAHFTHVNNQFSSEDRAWFTCRWLRDRCLGLQNWFWLFLLKLLKQATFSTRDAVCLLSSSSSTS